jgi:hypothetical protein
VEWIHGIALLANIIFEVLITGLGAVQVAIFVYDAPAGIQKHVSVAAEVRGTAMHAAIFVAAAALILIAQFTPGHELLVAVVELMPVFV